MTATPSLQRRVRLAFEKLPVLRHVAGIAGVVADAVRDAAARSSEYHEKRYSGATDPFGARHVGQEERYGVALELIGRIAEKPRHVLEIGCGEGYFTAQLAPKVRQLLAVDVSPTAVARARNNLQPLPNVEVQPWNMYSDAVPGKFDLIVIMTVLEYVHRPSHLREIRDGLVEGLASGGALLVESTASPVEKTWYGRRFARGINVNRVIAQHPALEEVARVAGNATEVFETVLFRKKAAQ